LIIIRHHGMRPVTRDEAVATLTTAGAPLGFPIDVEVNTSQFSTDGDGVAWDASNGHLWARAREISQLIEATPGARVVYFGGYPEVPHVVALGAYLGEHWNIEVFDRRPDGDWRWPVEEKTLTLDVLGVPSDQAPTGGVAVLRVEITATVDETLIRRFVSATEEVAHVRVRPIGADPAPVVRIQSRADVEEVRRAVRHAVSSILEQRPNTRLIHLFVAAPVSASFVTGQELRIRNTRSFETYRHRATAHQEDRLKAAFRITATGPDVADLPVTESERQRAAGLRLSVWEAALRDVERYAADKRRHAQPTDRWYTRLVPEHELERVRPYPALPPIHRVIDNEPSSVDPVPMEPPNYYGYQRADRRWRVSDRFLLRLESAFSGDLAEARTLVRLFMFHEASHLAHGIVKGKVEEVGKFANSLEHVDYTADLYAILHELDRGIRDDAAPLSSFSALRERVVTLIDLVIRSFWAFDEDPPIERMEIRRIRRYMNWYWQQVRAHYCRSPLQLAAVCARKPIIEISGLEPSVESRRSFGSLRRLDPRLKPELAIVLDNEELWRIPTSVTVPLEELIVAFRERNHADIRQAFRQIYENVTSSKHELPREEEIP
jgi:hypothetical protein